MIFVKKKHILLAAVVMLGAIYAGMLVWTIVGMITGNSPNPVSSLLLIGGQICFYIYICCNFRKYWNSQKDSE